LDLVTSGDAFVLNGDTFLCLDYRAMLRAHRETKARLTMAVRKIPEVGRYGSVTIEDGRIVGFEEKQGGGPGLISGGTYLMSPGLFDGFKSSEAFSFESDFLRPHVAALQPCAFNVDDYFIDIGIPDDYRRAQTELAGNECRPRPL
jgi:D-glycero-alpha-D-manno-heptose 1-phosphate guanylyltransferase